MSRPKELNFFVAELNWSRGLRWYERHFAAGAGAPAVGAVCPQYSKPTQHTGVLARSAGIIPGPKLIDLVLIGVEDLPPVNLTATKLERHPVVRVVGERTRSYAPAGAASR